MPHVLERLREQKQDERILQFLKSVEPRLKRMELNSVSGKPMILVDIGLSELVPLAMLGKGAARFVQIMLSIASSPNGLVLVDEIELGLHHGTLQKVWQSVDEAADYFNTQIIATTHSYECLQTAYHALVDKEGLLLHRLEVSEKGNRCVTYLPEQIDAVLHHNFEFR